MAEAETDLTDIGLNGYESAAYLALLGRSGLTSVELSSRAKIPRQRIYDVIQALAAKGLCNSSDTNPKLLFAVDPMTALPALSEARAAELERERDRVTGAAQTIASRLASLYAAGKSANDPLQYVEVLADPSRIASRALALAGASRHHVNSMIKRPMILSGEQNWRFLLAPLEKGVRYRALYEKSALKDQELSNWMGELSKRGQEIRLVETLPLKLQAFDDEVALVSMQDPVGGSPSFTALAIRHRGLVALVNLAFEALWAVGEDFEGEKKMTITEEIEIVEGYRPGFLGRIAEMHGVYYAEAWGSGFEFEAMMAEELKEFIAGYVPGRDLLLTAHLDGKLVGSAAVDGSNGARLRWVIVEEAYHGRGIGKLLVGKAIDFCRKAGFDKVYLWTVEGLPTSRRLYEKAGFQVMERVPDDRYSVPRISLRMELDLSPLPKG